MAFEIRLSSGFFELYNCSKVAPNMSSAYNVQINQNRVNKLQIGWFEKESEHGIVTRKPRN